MSNEDERTVAIDQRIGELSGIFTALLRELNRLYHREIELEALLLRAGLPLEQDFSDQE